MVLAIRRAGIDCGDDLNFSGQLSTRDAWSAVEAACGATSDTIAEAVASAFSMDLADLADAEPTATRLLTGSVARKFGVFPLRDENRYLLVATSSPADAEAEQAVAFASGRAARFVIASPDDIAAAIEGAYSAEISAASLLARVDDHLSEMSDVEFESELDDQREEISEEEVATGPVVKLTNVILHEAVARGASDIHIQPLAGQGLVRFRSDGVLHNGMQMPLPVLTRVVSRIKIMARLDITDRLRPQDGRARIIVGGKKYDLRVSTVPTRSAEKAVIRLLDTQGAGTLAETGIESEDIARIRGALTHRDGIVVVTGPTGSGKTTTLYGALREISTEDVNIMTVEDPVEYELPRLTQIQVEHKQGMTFSSALRAILRQDPDVIFVGEIRDSETAEIAAQASLTGHLVLATLHTNDAVGSLRRFLDLGLDAATLGETLRGALAQRLIRKVCPHCAERVGDDLTAEEKELAERFGANPVVRKTGCDKCIGQGYLGRLPVTEFMVTSPALVRLLLDGAPPFELQQQAVADGMVTIFESAMRRVAAGETTLEEVDRVVGVRDEPPAEPAAYADSNTGVLPTDTVAAVEEPSRQVIPQHVGPEVVVASGGVHEALDGGGGGDASDDAGDEDAVPHVLLVDDDGTTRALGRGVLESLGYRISESADGSDALLRLARGEHFTLMVLDLNMPRMGGREVLRAVRKSLATAGLPVIVQTGISDEGTETELMAMGADDYLRKPLDPPVLLARVQAAIRRSAG
jgi:type II secretory ATPase GspE/PulE/Tfp pilus assembly ATPase PilB-like protein/ActR/RegA family two-component response regulator